MIHTYTNKKSRNTKEDTELQETTNQTIEMKQHYQYYLLYKPLP